jgi:hypothetical protein
MLAAYPARPAGPAYRDGVAHDADLAARIRAALAGRPHVREVAMFGRLAFMVDERLTAAAGADGDLLVRCAPDRVDGLLGDGVRWAEMNGRRMSRGWLVVDAGTIEREADLAFWIGLALDHNVGR